MKRLFYIVPSLLTIYIFCVFVLLSFWKLDYDYGWHLRMGEVIIAKGIPTYDPFSYTMSHFHFIDHEWLGNLIVYLVHHYLDYLGVSLLFSVLFISTFFIIPKHLRVNALPIFLLFLGTLLYFGGVRFQVWTWLFMSIVLRILWNDSSWRKHRFYLPLLFILWSNTHASFPLGLIIIIFFMADSWVRLRFHYLDLILFFFSFGATFLNPYGYRIWYEVGQQIFDIALTSRIQEWNRLGLVESLGFWFGLALVFFLGIRNFRQISSWKLVLLFFLFFISIRNQRHLPLLIYSLIWIGSDLISNLQQEIYTCCKNWNRWMHAYIIFCIFCFFISLFDSGIQIARVSISMKGAYPISAVKWLQTQKIEGRVFADYRWGGFLINTLQNQKVFIDGRMPSWRGHMYPGESESAMDDYFTILAGQYHRYFNDYSVNYVLWPRGEYAYRMGFEPQLLQDNQLSLFLSQLRQDGWHLVYQDDVALIYRR